MATHILFLVLLFICSSGYAYDPSPLQDFCVADLKSPGTWCFLLFFISFFIEFNVTINVFDIEFVFCFSVLVNGFVCKNPKLAQANDFFFAGLDKPGNTSNPLGLGVTPVTATQIPGLNTLGISSVRIDYALNGLNPPHTHPRATEILAVLKGTLYAGFVTSNPENRLFSKVLKKGDVFVFPMGLIHFQLNVGKTNAVAISSLSSQNPGVITIANAVFGSKPRIHDDVLRKAFQVDKKVIDALQAHFWMEKN